MKKLSVAIIGAGKVGTAFALALKHKRIKIISIVDRSAKKARELSKYVKAQQFTTKISEISEKADLFIISVQDRYIKEVSYELSQNNFNWKEKFAFHTSGALTSDELKELEKVGCNVFSLHPNFSFVSNFIPFEILNFNKSVFALETSSKISKRFAIDFCKKMNWEFFVLKKEQKEIYHSLAVLLSNYTVTQFYQIEKVLGRNAVKSYLNLLLSTIQNIQNFGVEKALTGPISRGDILTVRKNLEALDNLNDELKIVYKKFGILTLEIVKNKIDKIEFDELEKILSG
ncbi:MAG: Rossmann-like and DUF2520 domain-containing protein [Ignavibacteria bacterium]